MILQYIFKILSALVTVYWVLCFLRIMTSWLPGVDLGRGGYLLSRTTDPFLSRFSRISWLKLGQFDFSPIFALAILTVLNSVFMNLGASGFITVGKLLGVLLLSLWAAFGFVFSFLAVCALLRVIVAAARWNSLHAFWRVLDSILNPVLYRINRLIYRGRIINYLQSLVTGFVVLVLIRILGDKLVGLLVRLLDGLPF